MCPVAQNAIQNASRSAIASRHFLPAIERHEQCALEHFPDDLRAGAFHFPLPAAMLMPGVEGHRHLPLHHVPDDPLAHSSHPLLLERMRMPGLERGCTCSADPVLDHPGHNTLSSALLLRVVTPGAKGNVDGAIHHPQQYSRAYLFHTKLMSCMRSPGHECRC